MRWILLLLSLPAFAQFTPPSGGGSGSAAFSAITAGTNTAALVIGTGGSLTYGGTGTIEANKLMGVTLSGLTGPIYMSAGVPRIATGTCNSGTVVAGDGSCVVVSSAFSAITSATNTSAAMVVGTGASLTVSTPGALSAPGLPLTGTWVTGGSATTTKPYTLIEPAGTTSTGWSTLGTGIGVNAASGFTGCYADLQLAGSSVFKVCGAGVVTATGNIISSGNVVAGNTLVVSGIPASSGTRYLCISTAGVVTSATVCTGT